MEDRQREDRETIDLLLTGPGKFLLWLYERQRDRGQTEISLGEARRVLGSKVYTHAYKLALIGLIEIINNNKIKLTDSGKGLASCFLHCANQNVR